MSNITDLYAEADLVLKEIENQLDSYRSEKKKLSLIEDSLVESREQLRSLKETIRVQENENDFRSLIDESREAEIISFRERLSLVPYKNK
jgi:hypothetical protein